MLTDYLAKLRSLSRDVRLLLCTSVLVGLAPWGVYSVLLNLYLIRLGYGPRFIGLLNGAGVLSAGVFSLPIGLLSERAGVRRALIAGMSLAASGFLLLPLTVLAPAGLHSSWLVATNFLGYLGLTLWAVNSGPFVAAATSEDESSHAFSLSSVLLALGRLLGSLVASYLPALFAALLGCSLDDPAPYRCALLSAGVLLFAGIPLLAATSHPVRGLRQEEIKSQGRAPLALIAVISLVVLLTVIGEGAACTFLNVYLDRDLSVSTSRIGALAAVGQLLALPAALAMPLLAARIGKDKTVALGKAAMVLCMLPMALLPHWLAAGVGFVGVKMLVRFSGPAFSAFQQASVQPRWRAAMSGATTMAAGLGYAAAAFGGGYLVTAVGYRHQVLIGAAVSLVGILLFWAYFVFRRRATEGTPDGLALRSPAQQVL